MGKGSGSAKFQVTEYRASMHLGLCLGPVDAIHSITIGDKKVWSGNQTSAGTISVNSPNAFGGEKKEGGAVGKVVYLPGADDQLMPSGLAQRTGRTPQTSPGYRGLASLFFVGDVGSSSTGGDWSSDREAYLPYEGELESGLRGHSTTSKGFLWSHNAPYLRPVEVELSDYPRRLGNEHAVIGVDANPAHIIYEALVDDFGMGESPSAIDTASFQTAAETLYDEGFGLSLAWFEPTKVRAFVQEIIDHIQAVLFIHPRTAKWTLKLLRDDYDVEGIPVLDMTNADLTSYQVKGWGEVVNEIVVTWTNPVNEKEETVTAQNNAAMEIQGAPASAGRNYYGIRNAPLAMVVCTRDLRQASTPTAAAEVEVHRSSLDLLPGSVVRLNWPEHDMDGEIFRVMSATRAQRKAHIRVNLLQDIFSLTRPALAPDPGTGWEDPSVEPEEVDASLIFTLPYAMALRAAPLASEESFEYPEAFTGVLGFHDSADVYQVDVLSEVVRSDGLTLYRNVSSKEVPARTVLTAPMSAEVETSISDPPGADIGRAPLQGGFAVIGEDEATAEICLVTADDPSGWLLQRGAFDTIPRNWPVGTPVWFFDDAEAVADTSAVRGAGETAKYKMLARTSQGVLDSTLVSPIAHTVTDRAWRPVRPANVKVNGQAFGLIELDDIAVTWSRRNRLTEDAIPLAWDDGDVIPETGQTTVIRALDPDGNLVKAWLDVPGTSITIPASDFGSETAVFLQVFSARDNLASIQCASFWLLADGVEEPNLPPGHDDLDATLPGTHSVIETSDTTGWNLCPDPFFQDPLLWGMGSGPWYSVSRLGTIYAELLGVPKVAQLSGQWYTGTARQTIETPVLGGLFGSDDLILSAKAKVAADISDWLRLEVAFYRSDTGVQLGSNSIVWVYDSETYQELVITPPEGADARRFRVYQSSGDAWLGNAVISDVRLSRNSLPAFRDFDFSYIEELVADLDEYLSEAVLDLVASVDDLREFLDGLVFLEGLPIGVKLITERETRVTNEEAALIERTTQSARIDDNIAAIIQEASVRATADSVEAAARTVLAGQVDDNEAAILQEASLRVTADLAEANARQLLTVRVDDNEAAVLTNATAIAGVDFSFAQLSDTLGAYNGDESAFILNEFTVQAGSRGTLGSIFTGIEVSVGDNASSISTLQSVSSTQGSILTSLTSDVGGNSASITTLLSVTDGLAARAALVINVNGVLTGYDIDGSTGDFVIAATTFAIADTSGSTPVYPFVYSAGLITMAANVRVGGNLIVDGTITGTAIATETINTTNIIGGALTDTLSDRGNTGTNLSTSYQTISSLSFTSSGGWIEVSFTLKVGNDATQNVGVVVAVQTPGGTDEVNCMVTKSFEDTISATFSWPSISAGAGTYILKVKHVGGQDTTTPSPVPEARTHSFTVKEFKR